MTRKRQYRKNTDGDTADIKQVGFHAVKPTAVEKVFRTGSVRLLRRRVFMQESKEN